MPDYFLLSLRLKADLEEIACVFVPGTTLTDIAAVMERLAPTPGAFHLVAKPLTILHPLPPALIGYVADATRIRDRLHAWQNGNPKRKLVLRRMPESSASRTYELKDGAFRELPLEGSPFEAHLKASRAEHSAKVQADNRTPQMAERAAHRKLSPQVAAMHARRPGRR